MPYEYKALYKKVIDGDTLVMDIDLGFNIILSNQYIRLLGIDAPESKSSDKIEKIFGNLSKEAIKKFMESCSKEDFIIRTTLSDNNDDKFGRILGEVISINKVCLNDWLIKNNYAVKYSGENKDCIKKLHLENRKALIDNKIINLTYAQAGI